MMSVSNEQLAVRLSNRTGMLRILMFVCNTIQSTITQRPNNNRHIYTQNYARAQSTPNANRIRIAYKHQAKERKTRFGTMYSLMVLTYWVKHFNGTDVCTRRVPIQKYFVCHTIFCPFNLKHHQQPSLNSTHSKFDSKICKEIVCTIYKLVHRMLNLFDLKLKKIV